MKRFIFSLFAIGFPALVCCHAPDKRQEDKTKSETTQEKSSDDQHKKKEKNPADKTIKAGNLAFPTSQQPTPLISFGQNLIDENQFDFQMIASEFKGEDEYFINLEGDLIYGINENLAIIISGLDAVRFRQAETHSSGPEDSAIQFEYAPYTKAYDTFYDQMTLVANITIPTGSIKKTPPTGKGANTFFVGFTYSRVGINWFFFTSYGGIFCATSHRTTFGNQFLYQYGIGRRIFSNADWLFDWMLEFDGTYSCRDKIQGVTDPNSGGNIIYATPSLFLASKKHLVVQLGMGFPIAQQLYGHQNRKDYLLQTKISWAF